MGERGSVCRFLMGIPVGKKPLGRLDVDERIY
jgi:hypothetical protein